MSLSIQDSTINTSPSKQKYSFPKEKRFQEKYQQNCAQAFYALPSIKSSQAPSFGYGQKYDFSKVSNLKTPAPNAYNVSRDFEEKANRIASAGLSIGIGREELYKPNHSIGPGPGSYNIKSTISNKNLSFGIKGNDILISKAIVKNPGPGAYSIPVTINEKGKYFVSKFKNPSVVAIPPPSGNKADFKEFNQIPGPGHYHPRTDFNSMGSYFLSNFKSHNAISFPNGPRADPKLKIGSQNPGPGAYQATSDFAPIPQIKKN